MKKKISKKRNEREQTYFRQKMIEEAIKFVVSCNDHEKKRRNKSFSNDS